MDIEKILIYIVLGAIYYGFKFLKKRGEKAEAQRQVKPKQTPYFETFKPDPGSPGNNPSKNVIVDLLEEIKKKEKLERYEERPYSESRSLEGSGYETGSEKIVIENVNPYTAFRSVSAEDTEAETGGRFSAFETQLKKEHPIKKVFTSKLKMREAIIVSEILKRKV